MAPKRKRTSSSTGTTYQVFLTFRGPDTRQGFADVLYHALTDAGIHVFRDDEEIRKGEDIGDEILRAIGESRIFVPIFSRGYASSKWCLIELSKMFESMEASPESGKKILPVFYDVSVNDVELKTGLYAEALLKHREKFTPDTVQQWEEALRKAGKINGYELKETGHGKFAKMLVREISMKLKVKHKYVTKYLVQRDDQVDALMKLLDIEGSGVRFVRIHGMGGIGKTTLAKVVFNKICYRYECCCFIADVRESRQQYKGIENLQKQLLRDLGHRSEGIVDVSDGIEQLKQNFLHKKVLIVLDDVDHKKQIQNLAGDASWFGSGSRIIITTRNQEVLGKGVRTFEVVEMETEQALKLFSMHAFAEESPPIDYLSLSKEAVESTGRLPLALEVIGSHLRDKPLKDWTKTIKRLKKAPHKDVQEKLMISYKALDHKTKQIFLDIACFFIGHDQTLPLYMWEACGFDAKMELKVLIHMSLVKIDVGKEFRYLEIKVKRLWMHDQLRDLGREIVRVDSFNNGVKCNRLWMHEDAFEVLREGEEGNKLKVLDLSYTNLIKTPDLSKFPNLERLILVDCMRLVEIDPSIGKLKGLKFLNVSRCISLKSIPDELCSLDNLEVILISACSLHTRIYKDSLPMSQFSRDLARDFHMPESIGNLGSLLTLVLHEYPMTELPESLGRLSRLRILSLCNCSRLARLPDSLADMKSLVVLRLSCTNISELPQRVGQLVKLELLDLNCCWSMKKLPESIGDMKSLVELNLEGTGITEFPATIGMLKRLEIVCARDCMSLVEIPSTIKGCTYLRVLDLNFCENMKKLPDSVGYLRLLVELHLSSTGTSELPDTIGNLKELRVIKMNCSRIGRLPTSIGALKRLEELHVRDCEFLTEVPSEIKECTSLRVLDLRGTGVNRLPPKLPARLTDLQFNNWAEKRAS